MKTLVRGSDVTIDGIKLPILSGQDGRCYREILVAIKCQMDAMLSHHSRVLFLRIDLRARNYCPSNKPISCFLRKLKKRLSVRYGFSRIGHIWAREIEKSKSQHWHLVLLLDASKVRHPKKVIGLIEEIAEGWDWPKPYTPKNCYRIVHRGCLPEYQMAFRRASYLAKVRGKGYRSRTSNDFHRSCIQPRCSSGTEWGNLKYKLKRPNDEQE